MPAIVLGVIESDGDAWLVLFEPPCCGFSISISNGGVLLSEGLEVSLRLAGDL